MNFKDEHETHKIHIRKRVHNYNPALPVCEPRNINHRARACYCAFYGNTACVFCYLPA